MKYITISGFLLTLFFCGVQQLCPSGQYDSGSGTCTSCMPGKRTQSRSILFREASNYISKIHQLASLRSNRNQYYISGQYQCYTCSQYFPYSLANSTQCATCLSGYYIQSVNSDCGTYCTKGTKRFKDTIAAVDPVDLLWLENLYDKATSCTSCVLGYHTLSPGTTSETYCQTVCGDGQKVSGVEQCDDGNTVNGDGCSSVCLIELGYQCIGGSLSNPDTPKHEIDET